VDPVTSVTLIVKITSRPKRSIPSFCAANLEGLEISHTIHLMTSVSRLREGSQHQSSATQGAAALALILSFTFLKLVGSTDHAAAVTFQALHGFQVIPFAESCGTESSTTEQLCHTSSSVRLKVKPTTS